jgi:D-arabinose 1-dehydrogenase-like Zn-dependent alcohol dehydrogenase
MSPQSEKCANVAVFTQANEDLEIRQYPVDPPRDGDVLLSLERSGICGTDIHIHEGRLAIPGPFIPGHEFIGRVAEVGGGGLTDAFGKPLTTGDLAVVCAANPCGECLNCRTGETASCLAFGVTFLRDPEEAPHFHGGFGEFVYSQSGNLVAIPESVDLDAAAAFPCAGPTTIRAVAYGGGLNSEEIIVVQGTGPVGLFAIAYAAQQGCTVLAIGSSAKPERMELAKAFGASEVFDYRATSIEERLEAVRALATKENRGDGADVVIEASGAPQAFVEGLQLLRTRGRYMVPGQYSDSGEVAIPPHAITLRALQVIGSGQYTLEDVKDYLDFLSAHKDLQQAFARTITHRYKVADANSALACASEGASIKGVFVP